MIIFTAGPGTKSEADTGLGAAGVGTIWEAAWGGAYTGCADGRGIVAKPTFSFESTVTSAA